MAVDTAEDNALPVDAQQSAAQVTSLNEQLAKAETELENARAEKETLDQTIAALNEQLTAAVSEAEQGDVLCDYMDYRTIASWAKEAMAFCYKYELLDTAAMDAEPKREILRCEVAEMLYRMLVLANLI